MIAEGVSQLFKIKSVIQCFKEMKLVNTLMNEMKF